MPGSHRRMLPVAVAVAVAVVGLAACTPAPHQVTHVSEVRIGLLAPLSGTSAQLGRDAKRGAELAASVISDSSVPTPGLPGAGGGLPGLSGATLTIVAGDTADQVARGETQAVHMATHGVAGLVSAGDTRVTAAASERTERLHVPFVSGDAPAGYLTERGMDWFFRTAPTDRMLGETLLSMLGQAPGGPPRRLGVVHTTDEVGNDAAAVLASLADEAGDTITATGAVRPGATDARAAVGEVRAGRPDAVIAAAAQPGDAARLLGGFRALGYRPPVLVGMGAGFAPPVVQAAAGLGVLRVTAWSAEPAARNPAASAVMAMYQRDYGAPMSQPAAAAFTAVLTLAEAISQAHSTEPQQIRAALLGLDLRGRDTIMPWRGIRFDQTGQNVLAAGVIEQLHQNTLRVVFPPELAAAT